MFKSIVVGLDGSDHANNALGIACDLAGKYDSDLHLIHTPQPHTVAFALGAVAGYHAATTMPSEEEVKTAATKILEEGKATAKEHGHADVMTHIGQGDPADEIIECATSCGADLIVTGRRGLSAVGALMQGSTTQKVNHHATCACLSVL